MALFCCAVALAVTLCLLPSRLTLERRRRAIHAEIIRTAKLYVWSPEGSRFGSFEECRFEETSDGFRVHLPATLLNPTGYLTGEIDADVRELPNMNGFKFDRFDFIPAQGAADYSGNLRPSLGRGTGVPR